ncbi:MAG: AMP-binding protein [Xanthobacteraceae bacterium]
MILGDRSADSVTPRDQLARATLDDLFGLALARHPDALALTDPPDRELVTNGAPRRLTFAQADRAISAIARALQGFRLPMDSIVGVQLPNTVESVLVLLGALRAGLVVAPIPLLWRTSEMTAMLGRIGARALICCGRVGSLDHCELAMAVAAETFAIRFVAGFGDDLPDGVVSLDHVFSDAGDDAPESAERGGRPADHMAVVTFDVTPGGIVPLARNHTQLVAAGSAVVGAAGMAADAAILAAFATSSFAGLSGAIVPWLLTGGTLALHQPFAPATFSAQLAAERCDTAVVPGPLVGRMLDAGLFAGGDDLKVVVAVWRAPERLAASAAWPGGSTLVDMAAFGEIGLVATRRSPDGKPAGIPVGGIMAADGHGAPAVIEIARTANGTVALRGAMVPSHSFPLGATRGDRLRLKIDDVGFVDTEFACRLERDGKSLVVNGAPPGVVSVGGYRFALRDLQSQVARIDEAGSLAALPDLLAGSRLAGAADDRDAMCQALTTQGANPLVVAAFRGRRAGRASAA